ncbi:MAG: L-aspartate oxidase [Micrococcales bacterium]|nr:L-aspartate oxidase [Micrococcales bacterium]
MIAATATAGPRLGVRTGGLVAARLAAPEPTWTVRTDVLVVGSGVAGLSVVAGLAGSGLDVMLVTKGALDAGATPWAQGGIARATLDADDTHLHAADTLAAGAGLCDPVAVRRLAAEGRAAVEALAARGARFDVAPDGTLAQTREGGHSRARIVHAGGDATGAEVQRALSAALVGATVQEQAFLLDLDRADDGQITGARIALLDRRGYAVSVGRVAARATVLATGGLGHVFGVTTNPSAVTGDGMAAALRAGATLRDIEFVQFHPTVLADVSGAGGAGGQTLLISEALRGEGAVLVDAAGDPVMAGVHPLADLAPRDVVAAREAQVMAAQRVDHVYLDARAIGRDTLERRFPTVLAGCRAVGIDPVTQPIPVRPAQHYSCGGVAADLDGRTSLPGLYAVGEVACTGVHGANRLASNSLLEGLVAGTNTARLLCEDLPAQRRTDGGRADGVGASAGTEPESRGMLARAMQADAGVLRTPDGLEGLAVLQDLTAPLSGGAADLASWEATNLHALSTVLVAAASARTESRGCHRRTDITEPSDAWAVHLDTTVVPGASATVETVTRRAERGTR